MVATVATPSQSMALRRLLVTLVVTQCCHAISPESYNEALQSRGLKTERAESLKEDMKSVAAIFKEYDKNDDEYLTKAELSKWVKDSGNLGQGLGGSGSIAQQAEAILVGVDSDRDGRASIDEFTGFLLSLKRTEGEPQPFSVDDEPTNRMAEGVLRDTAKKRPIVTPDGMSEEEARKILAERDAKIKQHAAAQGGAPPQEAKKKRKKKRSAAKKDEV